MRIDLTRATADQIASESTPHQVNAQNIASSDSAGEEDRTTLSSAKQSVGSLVSDAMSSPDVRQDLVDNLKQAINSGKYELDPGKIAQSMIDEHA